MFEVKASAKTGVTVKMDHRTAKLLTALLGSVGDCITNRSSEDVSFTADAFDKLAEAGLYDSKIYPGGGSVIIFEDVL